MTNDLIKHYQQQKDAEAQEQAPQKFDYGFNPKDVINWREAFAPPKKLVKEPKIDEEVSKVVGQKVYTTDPRLMSIVLKWKAKKKNQDAFDNYLQNPQFIKELKRAFEISL